ncbi:MAG: NAD(P)/FAD-dependent oxidoreductase [Candidatus Woesearchaeota archaeon]
MISVIGGGPAGSYSAYLLAEAGYDVDIYEDHNKIGLPIQCSGIVTSAINDIVKIKPELILNKITTMRVNAQDKNFEVKLKDPDLILNRAGFDQFLADKAVEKGAGLYMGHKLIAIENQKLKFWVQGKPVFVHNSKHVVGADGPMSIVGKHMDSRVKRFFVGSQVLAEGNFEKEIVQVFLFNKGFGWIIPENETRARIGAMGYKDCSSRMEEILSKVPNAKVIEKQGGLIPIYSPFHKTYSDNNYLIGDSAGMVKATTGGGIVQAMQAAQQLVKSFKTKQNYETLWKQTVGKDLFAHLAVRKALDCLGDNDLKKLVELTSQEGIKTILSEHSRDKPLGFGLKLLKAEPKYALLLKSLIYSN